jgi:hypothetical protein
MVYTSWFRTTSESFDVNVNYSGSVVIQKILQDFPNETHAKSFPIIVAPPDPQGHDFNKFYSTQCQEAFM